MKMLAKMAGFMSRSFRISDTQAGRIMIGGSLSDSGESVSDVSVLGLSSVWSCVNLLAGTIASLPLDVYRTEPDGRRTLARDHPLSNLLRESPNFDQTALDFWEFMQASLELWGNAYAMKVRGDAGRIVALLPVHPAAVMVRRLALGSLEYRFMLDGKGYTKTDEEVLHIRGFGGNPLGGMSTLAFCRQTFGLSLAINKAASTTFSNGMRPAGVLTFGEFLSTENRAIAETRLLDKYMGAHNAGRPLILEGGAKWEQLSLNPEDAQMIESRKMSVQEICSIFGVPPFMIGQGGEVGGFGTGLEQQTLGFQKFTLRRRLRRIEQAIGKQLLTAADRVSGVVVEFNLEGLLRGDSAARSAFYAAGLANGWITINEVRALENMGPVEGGEVPRMQMQNVPITEAGTVNKIGTAQ